FGVFSTQTQENPFVFGREGIIGECLLMAPGSSLCGLLASLKTGTFSSHLTVKRFLRFTA
ncbi:MAG: hypothetical protein WA635_04095, partial [Gallionella sp.]